MVKSPVQMDNCQQAMAKASQQFFLSRSLNVAQRPLRKNGWLSSHFRDMWSGFGQWRAGFSRVVPGFLGQGSSLPNE